VDGKYLSATLNPKENRFSKIQYPLANIGTSNIWSQIPLYGTVVTNLPPWPREKLLEHCGWGTDSDIQNLISLSKESGKVQFMLTTSPTDYEHLDYLHPIFIIIIIVIYGYSVI